MTLEITPLDASFGARIENISLSGLKAKQVSALYELWLEYGLLVFPGQNLTRREQITFARHFGKLEVKMVELSNVKEDGSLRNGKDDDMVKILKGNMGWHQDSTYLSVQAKGAAFSAHVVPTEGGETAWSDTAAAYDALDDELKKRIDGLSAYHSLHHSQQKAGFTHKAKKDSEYSGYGLGRQKPPLRPLVKTHAETGRKVLTIGRHAYGIPGLEEDESEKLLSDLVDFTCQAPRVYQHSWTVGDIVLWDNRRLMHQGCPWDMRERRVMLHSRIAGDPVAEFAAPA
ncbi:TauD/TfdA family dioxygenase [Sneathiella marina]|uniref:TauD/TfdA family dioxygenase n=1 Tax=Sneathiella marina TaxID=2950108 RepID=A0ABY4W0R5_9PROT|nr:TauD/TfdA family dioxygenase [Sneathiella marina]USG60549.1 TauD/TfdA family dioxygenase [Sneathiella marina]